MGNDSADVIARYISLGAGVQSSTLLMMANYGELGPLPDGAIFADTQWEPPAIYEHLDWLHEASAKIPIHVVTHGNLRDMTYARVSMSGHDNVVEIPAFVKARDGKLGMIQRHCTSNFKIRPIRKKVRELNGMTARSRLKAGQVIEQWIGITTDEAHRMRESDVKYLVNRYPLVDAGLSRKDCLAWWQDHFPGKALEKSACLGCPYQSGLRWLEVKRRYPEHYEDLVKVDEQLRAPGWRKDYGMVFLHPSRRPLAEAMADAEAQQTFLPDLFGDECHGVCGV